MLLQSLLPSGSAGSEVTPEGFQTWLTTLPFDRPGIAAHALVNEISRMRTSMAIRSRIKLLETAVEPAQKLLVAGSAELAQCSLPLSSELQHTFGAVNALFKTLATSYAAITDEIASKWVGIGFAKPRNLATVRAMQFQAQRLDLAYQVYARGSNSSWTELHRLYRIARDGGFAKNTEQEAGPTAEQIYLNALLLNFAEPTKLPFGELDRVRSYVENHSNHAELIEANTNLPIDQSPDSCFLIKPLEARAGRSLLRAKSASISPCDLVLCCTRLQSKLKSQLTDIENGLDPETLGLPATARQPQYVGMLRNLQRLWSLQTTRRFSRQNFKPRVDIVVGFDALWSFLNAPAAQRRSTDEETTETKSSLVLSEWAIGNESPSGFSLQYIGGNAGPVCVSEVIGLRPREQLNVVYVCATRRVVSGDQQSLELGLQKLAPIAKPVLARLIESNQQVRAIMLPRMPGMSNSPALLVPKNSVTIGTRLSIPQAVKNGVQQVEYAVETLLEQGPSCELYTVAQQG